MASHVVVIDSSARRTTVKTQPGTHLSDVLEEACRKLKLSPEQYSLKHNNKAVDLSRSFRLSGLPSGAQLELVQVSKSPTVVNVALQLPASEDNLRLTERFSSSTSLWQILRHFESRESLNFTQRGTSQTQSGDTGAGRLYYEMPVVDAFGRQMCSFVDLQKSLTQLGMVSGNHLLRLSFRSSFQPLEEAMMEISKYFKKVDESTASSTDAAATGQSQPGHQRNVRPAPEAGAGDIDATTDLVQDLAPAATSATTPKIAAMADEVSVEQPRMMTEVSAPAPTSARPVQLFHAPKSPIPEAAALPYNEADYVPGIEHVQLHQARLSKDGQNKRLPSDAELAAKEHGKQVILSKVDTVKARIRLPDQDTIVIDFSRDDTGADVYAEVRSRMQNPAAPFRLMYYGDKAQHILLEDGPTKLIPQLGWRGSLQVNMLWDDSVPSDTRGQPCLSGEWRNQRQHVKPIQELAWQENDDTAVSGSSKGTGSQLGNKVASVEEKLKKFLGVGRKK